MTSQGKPHPAGAAGPEREGASAFYPSASLRAPPRAACIYLLTPSPAGFPTTRTPQDASSAPPRGGGVTLWSRGGRGNFWPRGRGVAGVTCGPGPPRSSGRGSGRSPCPPAASPAAVPGVSVGRHSASRARRPRTLTGWSHRPQPPGSPREPEPPAPHPQARAARAGALPDSAHRPPAGSRTGVSAPGELAAAGRGAAAGPQIAAAVGGGRSRPRVSAKSAALPGPGGREAGRGPGERRCPGAAPSSPRLAALHALPLAEGPLREGRVSFLRWL